jgi:hypothetical protein
MVQVVLGRLACSTQSYRHVASPTTAFRFVRVDEHHNISFACLLASSFHNLRLCFAVLHTSTLLSSPSPTLLVPVLLDRNLSELSRRFLIPNFEYPVSKVRKNEVTEEIPRISFCGAVAVTTSKQASMKKKTSSSSMPLSSLRCAALRMDAV